MVVNRFRLWLLVPFLLAGALGAQALKVSSYVAEDQITLSDQLQVVLEISSDSRLQIDAPPALKIPFFSYRNMRNSSSSEMNIFNGSMSRSYTLSYTYFYNPQKKGKFSIPGFQFRIDKRLYTTPPMQVEVVDMPSSRAPQYNFNPYVDPYGADYFGRNRSAGESLILCQLQTPAVFVGEPAIASYYLYTNQMVESFSTEMEKDYEGYGKSNFEQPANLQYERVTYKGERYQRALIKRIVLYPQVSGRLQVPTLTGMVQFSGTYSFLNKSVDSQPAWLDVRALPGGKPAGYTGAVGNFSVSQSFSESKITQGDALICTIKISGKGNFSQFTAPAFPSLAKFQVSEPSVQDKLANPIEGTRLIYYTLLPQETGDFQIPGLSFSWFNTATGSYSSFQGQPQQLAVKPSNVLSYFSGLLQSDRPRTMNPLLARSVYPKYRNFSASFWFWLVFAGCLASLAVSGWLTLERRLRRLDPNAYAQKTANRILNKYLHKATEAAAAMSPEFYTLADSGLIDYLVKKFGVSRGLATQELLAELEGKVPAPLVAQVGEFLELCQKARYMPGGGEAAPLMDALAKLRQLVQAFSRNRTLTFASKNGGGKAKSPLSVNESNGGEKP